MVCTIAFEERHVFVAAGLFDVAGVFQQHAIELAVAFQRTDADAALGRGGLTVRHALVDLAPNARRDRRAVDELVAADFVGLDQGQVIPNLVGLGKLLGDVDLLHRAIHARCQVGESEPLTTRHKSTLSSIQPSQARPVVDLGLS